MMTRAEKIGTRRGFNNDVKNLGNGKASYQRYLKKYSDIQQSLTKNHLFKKKDY
jgi:hypothetical protein